jgi:hypothetical protein
MAVMMFEPIGNFDVLYSATPETRLTVLSAVVPFRNWTDPVGVPAADVTVAVKVTDPPGLEGFGDEVSVVAVVANTSCDKAGEVLPLKVESPLYVAVMECSPAASAAVENNAVPPLTEEEPRIEDPSSKVTVPVGVPTPFVAMVAEKFTVSPSVEGFGEEVSVVTVGAFTELGENWKLKYRMLSTLSG